MAWLYSILSVALSAAPWLLLGLLMAGLIKAFIPETLLQRWLGGRGFASIGRAAVIGVPLPLCSCGAIPTALALHRGGAGRGPTTSFLISTPSVGIDSILLTSVLLGPFMAVARVLGALVTAITTGWLVSLTEAGRETRVVEPSVQHTGCCGGCSDTAEPDAKHEHVSAEASGLVAGLKYAFGDLLDDISRWLVAGLVFAGVLVTLVSPEALRGFSEGLLPLVLMAVLGIPLYICAAAATPIAAGLLVSGISPGMALVFLLAGPVTSLATLGILKREMGAAALAVYISGILIVTVLLGLLLNQMVHWMEIDLMVQAERIQELIPLWLEIPALVVFLLLTLRPVRHRLFGF
ncbi:MAG: SO_0444 family Cu/Zn efflux transporter [Nitrincola lacisaponensis]|uniref:Transporter n=1 Tax=Nitrincola lacisaponensis TaxID=267850 RepID=A0A063Y2Y0_9GAMM|nr:SO_0444 family Cu/Zn efflux transporter [Nitrincola lacisaponensis]KDE39131.1 Transporter [Nitrincola lacisaponensis]